MTFTECAARAIGFVPQQATLSPAGRCEHPVRSSPDARRGVRRAAALPAWISLRRAAAVRVAQSRRRDQPVRLQKQRLAIARATCAADVSGRRQLLGSDFATDSRLRAALRSNGCRGSLRVAQRSARINANRILSATKAGVGLHAHELRTQRGVSRNRGVEVSLDEVHDLHSSASTGSAQTRPHRARPPLLVRPARAVWVCRAESKNFKGPVSRLLGFLRPHRPALIVVVVRA